MSKCSECAECSKKKGWIECCESLPLQPECNGKSSEQQETMINNHSSIVLKTESFNNHVESKAYSSGQFSEQGSDLSSFEECSSSNQIALYTTTTHCNGLDTEEQETRDFQSPTKSLNEKEKHNSLSSSSSIKDIHTPHRLETSRNGPSLCSTGGTPPSSIRRPSVIEQPISSTSKILNSYETCQDIKVRHTTTSNCLSSSPPNQSSNPRNYSLWSPNSYLKNFHSQFSRLLSISRESSIKIPNPISTRPLTLPPKSMEEEEQHRQEYHRMMMYAREREAQEQHKNDVRRQAREAKILYNRNIWTRELLPNWHKKKNSRYVRYMIWQGVPSNIRGRLWKLLIKNELHITKELYSIYVKQTDMMIKERLEEDGATRTPKLPGKLGSVKLIPTDLSRTFPALAFYQVSGPNHAELKRVLEAYVSYRPDIGYVQGMSYVAAILLLYMDDFWAFTCMANLLNTNVQLAFYKLGTDMRRYLNVFETLFQKFLPSLHHNFKDMGLSTEIFLLDWILTIYSKSLPLDLANRVWDIYLLEGEMFLFQVALGILYFLDKPLMACTDLVMSRKMLSRIPDVYIEEEEEFFNIIARIDLKDIESRHGTYTTF